MLTVLVWMASLVYAQEGQFIGRRVAAVELRPEGVLHPDDLKKINAVRAGTPLKEDDVARQIDLLFATGEFSDIRAEAEAVADGVRVIFVTTPARYLAAIDIRGKVIDPPNRGELTRAPRISPGAPFHDNDVQTAVTRMQRLLTANGFYESEVKPHVESDASGRQVFLQFDVRPGKRARYATPIIEGDAKLSEGAIIRATGWRIRFIHWWRQVTQARTRNGTLGILKKYQDEDRLRARVSLNGLTYDPDRRRVTPKLTLDAGPKVEVVATETKVSDRVLRRYVPVFQERAVDNDLLAAGASNLRDYFQAKGYFDAAVDFRTLTPSNDVERIEFAVSRGSRYKLVNVELTGNRYFDDATIRERMFLEPASFYLRRGRYSDAFRKKDEENISNLYRSNGFRDVKVTTTPITPFRGKEGEIGVAVRIVEGPQSLVESVSIEGLQQWDLESVQPRLASLAGQPFSEVNIAADRNVILDHLSRRGYPMADVQGGWRVVSPQRLSVVYRVTPGAQQFVREILITGLRQTRMRLIRERLDLHEGDPLSAVDQRDAQRRLYDMGIFSRVDTAIENPNGSTTQKTLLYSINEANRYTVSLGVGAQVGRFGTPSQQDLSSAGGSTGFSPQFSLNVSRLNFLGIGHTVSARGVYSTLQKRASISYFAPRFQNIEGRSLVVSLLYDQTRDIRTFSSKRQEVSIQASQKFTRATTGLFRIAYRRVAVDQVIIPVLLVPQILQPVRLGIVSANLARDRRDNSADAHRGSYNTADVGVSSKYIGSQRSFARVLLRNATYHPLTPNLVFARQTQFGWISPFQAPAGLPERESVPLPERFFGGGADSLRALPFNQAGPRDIGLSLVTGQPTSQATGFPLGGNALVFNNAELRFPLFGRNVQGVLFHDIGNVYSTIGDISFRLTQRDERDFNYAVHAAGFGVRYRTPVGPVRLDLAYTFNPPRYLGFSGTAAELLQCGVGVAGNSSCQSTPQRISHFQFFFSIGQAF